MNDVTLQSSNISHCFLMRNDYQPNLRASQRRRSAFNSICLPHENCPTPRAHSRVCLQDVRFSNRPVEVKRFQTHHDCDVDVTCGLALLFGIGAKAFPSWDSRTRWNDLYRGLAVVVGRSKRTCELTSSTVPRGTSFHRLVELEFPPIALDSERPHAAAASLVHLNSVPSVQMRCIITARRRASATIAFFIPRCLAIFIAQALSQDHFAERNSMTWAAS
jgi:hypothetical protein